jgi:hypothetical protein
MNTKTLADLKRDIQVGKQIYCNGIEEAKYIDNETLAPLEVVPLKEAMQGTRTITYKDTTGFYLSKTPEDGKRGSFCNFPKASALQYDGKVFTITETTAQGQVWQRRHYVIV